MSHDNLDEYIEYDMLPCVPDAERLARQQRIAALLGEVTE